ncbi:AfsR/SARP family transcriptional regulator [Actinoplanes sp. TFC3]|uniref:AfsR/SARP family transcriptional regulator n=1 Tax=Actinoplanes sp. TFC3 TaxID=1710355 RepID=UPI00082B737A|nr:AfsR/SARP family transcriptional regulator [Actinoplanes sp. TFC3]
MPAKLDVAVLGPVRAWTDGRPVRLGTARQRTIFAVLVAAAGQIVTPADLIAAVWGASPPSAARDNIYTYISGLRRSLTDDVLESHPTGYRLRLDPQARDVMRFETLAGQAADREEAGDRAGAAALLHDALQLWRGEPYTGCEGARFEVDRAYLNRLHLDAIERRARLLIALGDDDAVAELAGIVRAHPLHEPFHELLMRALLQAGRVGEALAAFRSAEKTFAAELGAQPGAMLRELHGQIPSINDTVPGSGELLRLAAVLGSPFDAAPLLAASGQPPADVMSQLEDALDAGVLVDTGDGLAFSDVRWAEAVVQSLAREDRLRLHRRLAEALASLGSPAAGVAVHLSAGPADVDPWLLVWAVAHLAELAEQAPARAVELGRRVLDSDLPTEHQRAALLTAHARAVFRLGGRPEHEARQALRLLQEPADRAQMHQLIAEVRIQFGDLGAASAQLTEAMADPRTPPSWRIRHRTLLARLGKAGAPYDDIAALQALWRESSGQREHQAALHHADRALALLGPRTPHAELHLDLLDNRIFSLQNLDRLDEADRTLHEAVRVGARHRLANPLALTAAVQDYWRGRWDDAVVRLSALTEDSPAIAQFGCRDPRASTLLLRGVTALINAHRGEPDATVVPGEALTTGEREHSDFLLAARAVRAEHRGDPDACLNLLAGLLDPADKTLLLPHQWLPHLVRVALQAGRVDVAERATELCAAEAARERTPARAVNALARCRALMTGDPQPALQAAKHYRTVGRIPERAAALAEAALLLGAHGDLQRLRRQEGTL